MLSHSLRPGAAPVPHFERCGRLTKRSTREGFDCKAPTCKGSVSYAGEAFGWHHKLQACLLGSLVQKLDHRHPEGCCLQKNPDRGGQWGWQQTFSSVIPASQLLVACEKCQFLLPFPFPSNNATGNMGGALHDAWHCANS